MESTRSFTWPKSLRNALSVELKQKRREVLDGECAQKETVTPAVFTSPQQLSGNHK